MRYLVLILLFLVMVVLQAYLTPTVANLPERGMVAMGFAILVGHFFGKMAEGRGLPKLTGYLLAGMLCGPYGLGFLQKDVKEYLNLIADLALGLIAFHAGGELDLAKLRPRFRELSINLGFVIFLVSTGMGVFIFSMAGYFGWETPLSGSERLAFALVLGVIAASSSLVTTMAVLIETKAKGIVAETALALVVFEDVALMFGFTLAVAVAKSLTGSGAALSLSSLLYPFWEILGSILLGLILSVVMSLYLKRLGETAVAGLLIICSVLTEITEITHLSLLLVCLVIGIALENGSSQGRILVKKVEEASYGVYVIFFSLAGAGLDFGVLRQLWPLTIGYCLVRLALMVASTTLGSRLAKEPQVVRRWVWSGLAAQGGVSLGLAMLMERHLPEFGAVPGSFLVATIAINEMVGPVLFQWGLKRAGEVQGPAE